VGNTKTGCLQDHLPEAGLCLVVRHKMIKQLGCQINTFINCTTSKKKKLEKFTAAGWEGGAGRLRARIKMLPCPCF